MPTWASYRRSRFEDVPIKHLQLPIYVVLDFLQLLYFCTLQSHDDDDPYSKMFGSDTEGGGADAGGGSSGPTRPFNRDLSRGIGLTNAIRGSSAVLRQMSFDPSEPPMTDPNKTQVYSYFHGSHCSQTTYR